MEELNKAAMSWAREHCPETPEAARLAFIAGANYRLEHLDF